MHDTIRMFVERSLKQFPPRRRIIEFGARNINGSIKGSFLTKELEFYIGIDMHEGSGVDIIDDASMFVPTSEQAPDTIVCVSVLEHTPVAKELVQNAYDILLPNGIFICTTVTKPCPDHSSWDGGPLRTGEFYQDVDPLLLLEWMKPFKRIILDFETFVSGDIFILGQKL